MSARLERDLLAAGQQVVRVPTKLMAQTRKSARSRGKSDPIDALAVARAVLRETDLPLATHDETSRELKLLTDRRDVLVAQRTSAINRLRWLVHELDPERAPAARSLDAAKHQQALRTWLDTQPGLVAELARAELTDIIRLTGEINTLAQRQRHRPPGHPALEIPGCAELTAANRRRTGGSEYRFEGDAFACHAAVAPIPVWSGNTAGQMRLSRSGNRQLNAALHRIALTQIRMTDSRGQAYYQRLQDAGKTKRAALRLPQTPPSPHRLPGPAHRPPAQLRTQATRGRLPWAVARARALVAERDRRLGGVAKERQRLLQVEAHGVRVVAGVPDCNVGAQL